MSTDANYDLEKRSLNKYTEYAECKRQQATLEARMKELSIEIISDIKTQISNLGETVKPFLENENGKFEVLYRTSFEYPAAIKKEEDLLKAKKKLAEEDGTATVKTTTEYVRFTQPK